MLHQLLDNLNSRDAVLREDAERRLHALPPDELMQFAQLEQAYFKFWIEKAWTKISLYTGLIVVAIAIGLGLVSFWAGRRIPTGGAFGPVTMYVLALLFYQFRWKQQPHSRHALANVIKDLDDVQFIPILLTMQEGAGCNMTTKKAVQEALTRLLPQLRARQANEWTNEQKQVILEWLASPVSNFELSIVALRALEQVGGEWAISAVKKCADLKTQITVWNKPGGISREAALEKTIQIKQAAQECLPYLEQHTQQAKQAQTLLRAAQISTPPDTLLRPAASAPQEAEGEQLLRPTSD